jgi:hypothetical protein
VGERTSEDRQLMPDRGYMREGIERRVEGGNELGSEPAVYEAPVDAFGKGASGISVGAGGFVEYLIFGCVCNQPQRYSIT